MDTQRQEARLMLTCGSIYNQECSHEGGGQSRKGRYASTAAAPLDNLGSGWNEKGRSTDTIREVAERGVPIGHDGPRGGATVKECMAGIGVSAGTGLASAVVGRYGLAGAVTLLGALAMVLMFAGWIVTRPTTGSFKIGPRGIEWKASTELAQPDPEEPEAPKPKRWRWRRPPPDS